MSRQQIKFQFEKQNFSYVRYWALIIALGLILIVIAGRLVQLQLLGSNKEGADFLQQQAEKRQVRVESIAASRGMITDRYGQPLAVSAVVSDIWVNPVNFNPTKEEVKVLSQWLSIDEEQLREKITKKNKRFVYLAKSLSPKEIKPINGLDIKGLNIEESRKRFYPAGEVAAQVVGLTNTDNEGIDGMELLYDDWLKSNNGKQRYIKDLTNNIIDDLGVVESPKPGKDLMLTLDMRMQYFAYKSLKEAVKKHDAQSGQSIVVDIPSGEILAMVSQPSFNPNNRVTLNQKSVVNRVVSDLFEPGSTMKPITVLAALESGRYDKNTTLDTSPGTIHVGKKIFYDPLNYGKINFTKLIQKSSQVGAVQLALGIEPQELTTIFHRLGIGQSSGAGLIGESIGGIPLAPSLSKIDRAVLSFGYGLEVNATQLARAYSIIANDGKNIELKAVLEDASSYKGNHQQLIDKELAQYLRTILVSVTEKGGTAPKAAISGYKVAGKSGTTHKINQEGYDSHNYRAVFVGMAPAEKPQVVTVVVIDNPTSNDYSGGSVAAPVFSRITSAALRYKAMDEALNSIAGTL